MHDSTEAVEVLLIYYIVKYLHHLPLQEGQICDSYFPAQIWVRDPAF